jgi:hypothetical protein
MPVRRPFSKWNPVLYGLTSGIKIVVKRRFLLAMTLVPVHVELLGRRRIENVNVAYGIDRSPGYKECN